MLFERGKDACNWGDFHSGLFAFHGARFELPRHYVPAGNRGKTEIPQRSEEAQVPPRGKRVAVAQWNERVLTT
ncbi:hypothetical protein A2U94_16915 [Bacillus sp. VT 712]|uniref:Uncharacterized protein n=1 Tax=Priestia veravalensis TaxID=1414648 RepID=A0A0V8JID8_9BACI|nr:MULTISPECIES: hypothetical protein [Priestia]KSU86805.1 hypothetical protein AS180_16515 [Priestia veravalensis]KZB90291.1 hypothetical protein A2U94_16915 [Bacillus sp. VT 712]SCC47540.1 hypothetical protein GA0061087_10545 [Priestia flexa]